ncbi:MAG: toprim domain-containing protein [Syntrophothermus sp.]|uniref:DUF3991 and toprim domain-containing protein n=1 Tax=Syntrophothermus sp. TaxID=2736299 RepID=UPI00257CE410|nr:toprim domain-containing protein [Syntrophothermus sp.]NSW83595.1 toprim domain-containing protein [Syntrophothermus sp.]
MLSPEQIRQARRVSLVSYLEARGYPLRYEGSGNWRLPGHGGLLIKDSYFIQFSSGIKGNAIDFLVRILNLPFQEAVEDLLALGPVGNCTPKPAANYQHCTELEFRLPERASDNRRVAIYLTKVRKLPPTLVGWLMAKGLLYQDVKANCVFPSYSRLGQPKGAFLRGTFSNFKGLAFGSDARYPWHWPPETESQGAVVCESPIDALSLVSLKPFFRSHHLVSLNGLRWEALTTFLEDWQEIKTVVLAFDGDKPGRTAAEEFKKRLKAQGYTVAILLPPGFKDWNETLVEARKTPG